MDLMKLVVLVILTISQIPYTPKSSEVSETRQSSPFAEDAIFVTPLVVDLNQDGKIDLLSAFDKKAVSFDLKGNGKLNLTGWIGATDGLLVRDVNGDGIINSGYELFGSYSMSYRVGSGKTFRNGFLALRQFDIDHNRLIDSKDGVFHELMVWQDQNTNGLTDSGELLTLEEIGVTSISLSYTKNPTSNGIVPYENSANEVRLVSKINFGSKESLVADVWFRQHRKLEIAEQYILPVDLYSQK